MRCVYRRRSPGPATRTLTLRETQVAAAIALGKQTKEIAVELGVSAKTAESHRFNLMRKLGLRGIADVTRYAIEYGLIDCPRPLTMEQRGAALCDALSS